MKIELQHSNRRKHSPTVVESNPILNESATLSTFKTVLSKISLPTFDTLERKESNMSNDVFYEVYTISNHFSF
jgi:hypothetical protein